MSRPIEDFLNKYRREPDYDAWRQAVLKRDNHTCQMPGCGHMGRVEAHHILKYSNSGYLRTVVENGITLCKQCHHNIYGKEEYFMKLFFEIIMNKKPNNDYL